MAKPSGRGWWLLAAALVVVLAYVLLRDQLTLAALKDQLLSLQQLQAQQPWLFAAGFFLAYWGVTALSLPGAAVMTLAAGALFGLYWGTLLVSFASSLGASTAFLSARYLFAEQVQRRFGSRLAGIHAGVAKDGAFYLFSLRLIPLVPFFAINLLMGLTPMRLWVFYAVSQLGMLAGTLVYVNAGTALAQVHSLQGLFSPSLWGSFVLLAAFPWLAKGIMHLVQRQRLYKGWKKPQRFDRNLIVIGAGAAGLVTAYLGAAVRATVTLIEGHRMGGDCLNTGCVPSKALIKSARLAHQMRQAQDFGLDSPAPRVDFARVMGRVRQVITDIEPHDSPARYQALGVEVLAGQAQLLDPWRVQINQPDGSSQVLSAKYLVLATGASPQVPAIPGLDSLGYWTSDTLWDALSSLEAPPARLLVVGGGPIGCELAQALARLGSQVTLVQRGPALLPREDAQVSTAVAQALEADGVRILLSCELKRLFLLQGQKTAELQQSGQSQQLPFDALLLALGRKPRLQGMGLEALGLLDDQGHLRTDQHLACSLPNIYAAGDVLGGAQFTHLAAHQAWYAAVNALFGSFKRFTVDYRVIPAVTFVDPEVARVGLNERLAQEQGIAYEVTQFDLAELDRAITDGARRGFVKVLTVPGRDRILGATLVGEHAGELLAEFTLAMRWGLGLNKILGTTHSYPTWSEANKYTAGQWKRSHAPAWALNLAARYFRWQRKAPSP
jgi:pyruvate/2-oxoglutarate dehydrogenase complex dihydrolipoamide dehydrogenase (E3) component/uncharacterized membrane protein YdjX (TVP38/TMEM64 family)